MSFWGWGLTEKDMRRGENVRFLGDVLNADSHTGF